MKRKPKFRVGQVVYAWKHRLIKIKSMKYRNVGDGFDGWWYSENPLNDGGEYSEREIRPLTQREIGPQRKTKGRTQ